MATVCIPLEHSFLRVVKERYGSDAEEDEEEDSEEAESEDEDGEELTPAVDAAILRTLAKIKRKDPEIYDAEKGIFEGIFVDLVYDFILIRLQRSRSGRQR
jgi:protein KRI1